MSYFEEPKITLSLAKDDTTSNKDYFDSTLLKNQENNFESDPPIIMNNKLNYHPLSKQFMDQKVHSAPILQHQLLLPPSILLKNVNSSPSIPKQQHIKLLEEEREFRRPSIITFKSTSDTPSIFYDAQTTFSKDEEEDEKPTIVHEEKKKKRIPYWRRPSIRSRISSAYTNKTTAITIDHIDLEGDKRYLQQGTLICAIVSKRKQEMEKQQKYHHQTEFHKRPLKWKEFNAVITHSGYLELYNVCHCKKNNLLHTCLHFRHKTPQHSIDLYPSVNNKLFDSYHYTTNNKDTYTLSLMSSIDFSWSLSSSNTIYYFQSNSVNVSQHWYRSLYTTLPPKSKLALPKFVDLVIPELFTSIRLPISELIQEEDENVELRKVLRSALVLLHRHGTKPAHWNSTSVGLCWKRIENDTLDWVLKPSDDEQQVAYLIEPRLIEKTHELQLRFWEKEEVTKDQSPPNIQGYLTDQSSSSTIANKLHTPLYATTLGQFLFLYQDKREVITPSKRSSIQPLCCLNFNNKRKIAISSSQRTSITDEFNSPRLAMGVIDLLRITDISEESSCDKEKEETFELNHHLLHLNDYSFQIMHRQPINDWSTRLDLIQKYYSNKSNKRHGDILQSNDIYIKTAKGKYHTFQKKLCVLTSNGDLCIFKKSPKSSAYKSMEMSISLVKENMYIYSGEECCNYITRLPLEWSSRIFENGSIEEENKPNQCCFVIHFKGKDYVFLTRSPKQKESWVQSICSFL